MTRIKAFEVVNLLSRQTPGFPPVERALRNPNGLLAVGGLLDVDWLTTAYRRGIFPWFDSDDSPILWWSPDPRSVILPDQLRITRSLVKRLRNGGFELSADTVFARVLDECASARADAAGTGTWITAEMKRAYQSLHESGLAHSIEVWRADRLVGGLYGVSLGRMFFGESMFSREPDASKVALCHLARQLRRWDFWLIDCQVANPHLTRMGAVNLRRREFIGLVERNAHQSTRLGPWTLDPIDPVTWTKQP